MSLLRKPLKIAIDYDGTIADTNAVKAAWIKEHLGVDVPRWKCDRTSCVQIIGPDNYELMSAFVYGEGATLTTKSIPGAIQGIETLSHLASLYVMTNRHTSNIGFAQTWLKAQNVATFFRAVISSAERSKARMCADYGINILLDDDIRHLIAAENPGLQVLLFKPGPDEDSPSGGIRRVRTWQEFVAFVDAFARKAPTRFPSEVERSDEA